MPFCCIGFSRLHVWWSFTFPLWDSRGHVGFMSPRGGGSSKNHDWSYASKPTGGSHRNQRGASDRSETKFCWQWFSAVNKHQQKWVELKAHVWWCFPWWLQFYSIHELLKIVSWAVMCRGQSLRFSKDATQIIHLCLEGFQLVRRHITNTQTPHLDVVWNDPKSGDRYFRFGQWNWPFLHLGLDILDGW